MQADDDHRCIRFLRPDLQDELIREARHLSIPHQVAPDTTICADGADALRLDEIAEKIIEREVPDTVMWWYPDDGARDNARRYMETNGIPFVEWLVDDDHHFFVPQGYDPSP